MTIRQEKVDFRTLIKAPPERVYDAISTGQGLDEWFTKGAEVEARPGGHIHFRWKDWGVDCYTGEARGPVLEARSPERFVFQWPADSGGYETTVQFDLSPTDHGTMVRVREEGYEDSPVGMQDLLNRVAGWAEALTILKFYLEYGARF